MVEVAPASIEKCVVVTRPRAQQTGLMRRLENLGFTTLSFPTIEIGPWYDQQVLRQAIADIASYRWLVFTSVNGARFFFEIVRAWGLDKEVFSHLKIAAIGSVTANALVKNGLAVNVCPPSFVAESLAQAMLDYDFQGLAAGGKVLLPRAAKAREVLGERLREAGAHVDIVPVYRTQASDEPIAPFLQALKTGRVHCVSFTSSSTVSCFFEKMPPGFNRHMLANVKIAAIGPITAETLKTFGFPPHIVAPLHTTESLALAISEYFRTQKTEDSL